MPGLVGIVWPGLFSGQGAREEELEPPASEKALGEGAHCGAATPGDGRGDGTAAPKGVKGGRTGAEGAGCCHFGSGEGGCWPTNVGPSGGLGGALLGGWAEPAARGCGGPAASGGGNIATPPNLTTCPCPPIPFNASGWRFAGLGYCCSLATFCCPYSYPASCWAVLVGELAQWPEAPEPWWPRAGGGRGKGGVVDSPPRPRQPRPAVALPAPTLPPLESPLYRRGRYPAPGLGCRKEVPGPI